MEPDPAARTLGWLAELNGIPTEDWTEGSVADVAFKLGRLHALIRAAQERVAAMSETLVASMEYDTIEIPGGGVVTRSSWSSSQWRDDGASERLRDDLAQAVAQSVSVDVATGEIDPAKRNVALATMRAAYRAIPAFTSLKTAGRNELGLHLGDYRVFEDRWRVNVEGVE